MERRVFWLCVLSFLMFAEALSWIMAGGPGPCLVAPEHSQLAADNDNHQDCPTFLAGTLLTFERVAEVIKRNEYDKAIVAIFTVVLAVSTIGLWLATIRLWETSAAQSRDIQESLRTARLSADVAIMAQVPFLTYEMELVDYDETSGLPCRVGLNITFNNEGHTPAIITGIRVGHQVSPSLPSKSLQLKNSKEYVADLCRKARKLNTLPRRALLIPNQEISIIPPDGYTIEISEEQRIAIGDGAAHLWIFGVLFFDNYLPDKHKPTKAPYPFNFGRKVIFSGKERFTHVGVPPIYMSR